MTLYAPILFWIGLFVQLLQVLIRIPLPGAVYKHSPAQ